MVTFARSARASNLVGLFSESGGKADVSAYTVCATTRREQVQQKPLLDHLVGAQQERFGDRHVRRQAMPQVHRRVQVTP